MAYRFKPGRSLTTEIRRIADKQLRLAIRQLRTIGNPRADEIVHEARRHVKKVRALVRLMRPALGDAYDGSNRRLRVAGRLLAPVADGEAVVDTLNRVAKAYPAVPHRTVATVRSALLDREARIDRKARLDRVLPRAAAVLQSERQRIAGWPLGARGCDAVAPGLKRSVRRFRRAAARAAAEPTAEHYHVWRRRTKDLWLQVRLLEGRCANKLRGDERRLDALDGCLGEHHNVVLLERILMSEPVVSRRETARCLHTLRRYQVDLRRRAARLGGALTDETPRQFVRRVKRLWQRARRAAPAATEAQWPHAA